MTPIDPFKGSEFQDTISGLPEVLTDILRSISDDNSNTLCIISGREKEQMKRKYGHIYNIYITAENGYYCAWNNEGQELKFEQLMDIKDWGWKDAVIDIIKSYQEKTDGSFINIKDSSIRWFYRNVDSNFGISESNELVAHLQGILKYLPLEIVHDKDYVEVRPIGTSKEGFTMEFLRKIQKQAKYIDFILCMGDSQSDEGMFKAVKDYSNNKGIKNVFCITVGQKQSLADYYVNSCTETMSTLAGIILPSVEVR